MRLLLVILVVTWSSFGFAEARWFTVTQTTVLASGANSGACIAKVTPGPASLIEACGNTAKPSGFISFSCRGVTDSQGNTLISKQTGNAMFQQAQLAAVTRSNGSRAYIEFTEQYTDAGHCTALRIDVEP